MNKNRKIFSSVSKMPILLIDGSISDYTVLDLSTDNDELHGIEISNYNNCQQYIDTVLEKNNASIAYGGYLEKRNLYSRNQNFSQAGKLFRNIHLGVDFWSAAGTEVVAPVDGAVHSFRNNDKKGDYGPTIILKHELKGFPFHTLYGHLALASLNGLYLGKKFKKGAILGALGTPDVNVNYAPHLHFQMIIDMSDKKGDYPGVCVLEDLEFYSKNCPDPNLLLGMP